MDAVRLSNEPGRTVAEVSDALGIRSELLYRWRSAEKKNGKLAFPGHGTEALTSEQKRIRDLEKALKHARIERDILKKAVGFFSKQSK
jgi:transposase-like protein